MFRIFQLVVLFMLGQFCCHVGCEPSLKINRKVVGPDWTPVEVNFTEYNGLYSVKGDDLFLTCSAPFPIQWKISGIIEPKEIVKIQTPTKDVDTEIYEIKLIIFFLDAGNYSGLAASASIDCEKVDNPKILDRLFVFVKGKKSFVNLKETTISNTNIIPCATTDPTIPISLYQVSSDGTELLENETLYKYIPTLGFISNEPISGSYVCRKDSESISFTIQSSILPDSEVYYTPYENKVRAFKDESIEFSCGTKSYSVSFSVENTDKLNIVQKNVPDLNRTVSATLTVRNSYLVDGKILTGKVSCLGEKKEVVREWTYEFVDAPVLYLDNYESEVDCISAFTPKKAQSVRCKNGMDCDFIRDCLRNESHCNFKKQKQFYADTDTYCYIHDIGQGKPCASVPFSHLNGVAQCDVMGLTRQWEYFISLEYNRYANWREAPVQELIRIEEKGQNKNGFTFLCTASAFLFADGLAFEVEYKNGSQIITRGSKLEDGEILELNFKAQLVLPANADVVGVNCIAPFWNTTEVIKVSHKFTKCN